ncbi:protein SPEAR1-like [Phragmites australis]|uniref:protein SPEAR1-like n=1 Tax=Phragmites australis TaxID=29695 RepID=UPI002D789CEE|nr:protein SPEAR1-like [Phragmites australis]
MEWGRGKSPGSRKGKRAGNSSSNKPRQPQRGLGVAQLEKIRMQSEMAEEYLHHPLGQSPPIHRTGSYNLEDARLSHSLPSSPSSSFHANISVSSSYPIHRPNLTMTYGERVGIGYGDFQTNPTIRSPDYHGAIYGSEAHYSHQSNVTLPLFEPEESIYLKSQHDLNQSAESSNSDDQQVVDLELKL